MEPKLISGDYVPDNMGGIVLLSGTDALLARVLFRLTARRGQFLPLPQLGSRFYLLPGMPASGRESAALQYAVEALAPEKVTVETVTLSPGEDGRLLIDVGLSAGGEKMTVRTAV